MVLTMVSNGKVHHLMWPQLQFWTIFEDFDKKHMLNEMLGLYANGFEPVLGFGFVQLLVGLVTAYRYDGDEVNAKLAKTEADILHESIKEKKGNHEEAIRILTTRSKTQLLATFNRYRDDHGASITKVHKKKVHSLDCSLHV